MIIDKKQNYIEHYDLFMISIYSYGIFYDIKKHDNLPVSHYQPRILCDQNWGIFLQRAEKYQYRASRF